MVISLVLYSAIAVITVLAAYKVRQYEMSEQRGRFCDRIYLFGIFAVLFIFSAIRFGVGNDYKQYVQTAHEAFVGGYVVTEAGFNWLVRIVYTLCGGEYYEVIFALFAGATLFLFLKALYEQSENFFQSFFLFMMFGLYFQTYNTMRYYLALAIALYSMRYVLNKDYIRFVLWIVVASFFHKSVLIVIPIYWIATFTWKRWQIILGLAFSAVCFLGKSLVLKLALILYPSYENTIYLEGGTSVVSIIRGLAVLGLYVWYVFKYGHNDRQDKENANEDYDNKTLGFYAKLNLLSVVVCIFFSFLPVITRIVYYLSISQLLLIPAIIRRIPDEKTRKTVKYIVAACCVTYFAIFLMTAGQPGVGLIPYKSWLFEEHRYIVK